MYGAPTWKRHIAWSSSPTVALLDLGTLCKNFKKRIAKFGVKSTKQYKSKSGKTKFCGSKSLRSTGPLGSSLVISNHFSLVQPPSYSNFVLESQGGVMNGLSEHHLHAFFGWWSSSSKDFERLWNTLRTYPPNFGLRIARLYDRFCKSRPLFLGCELDHHNLNMGLNLFESLPWSDAQWWEDARMESTFRYLRGAVDLRLGQLRPMFPTELWSLNFLVDVLWGSERGDGTSQHLAIFEIHDFWVPCFWGWILTVMNLLVYMIYMCCLFNFDIPRMLELPDQSSFSALNNDALNSRCFNTVQSDFLRTLAWK